MADLSSRNFASKKHLKMNKILSATALLSAAILAVSCQKENCLKDSSYTPLTISAVTEGINLSSTKASTAYKYDVLWGSGDKIIVKRPGRK